MIMELLGHKDYLRVLHAVRRRPMRFGELQKELALNPARVDRAVKFLRQGLWILPRVEASEKGRMLVQYELGKRGTAFLDSFKAFSDGAMRHKAQLGSGVMAELKSLSR